MSEENRDRVKREHVEWSKKLFDSLNDDGVWVVPRSGLTFRRVDDAMHLVSRASLKEHAGMTGAGRTDYSAVEEARWGSFQREDFRLIRRHFESAGVQVFDVSDTEDPPS
jgi:hypothetical protein